MTEPAVEDDATPETPPRPVPVRFGVALIVVSGVLWFSLFAIPFLSLTLGQKTALGGAVFVGVQITWWSGVALAGPRVVKSLTGWFRGL
jgi:hypothetical protein